MIEVKRQTDPKTYQDYKGKGNTVWNCVSWHWSLGNRWGNGWCLVPLYYRAGGEKISTNGKD